MTHQFVVFPVLCGLCIAEHGGPLTEWLRSYGNEYYFHRMFHHAFFGYLVKDLTLPITPVLLAHHVVCLGLGVSFIMRLPFRRIALCSAPASRPWNSGRRSLAAVAVSQIAHCTCSCSPMTLSNVISASFGVWYSLHYENVGLASLVIFQIVGYRLWPPGGPSRTRGSGTGPRDDMWCALRKSVAIDGVPRGCVFRRRFIVPPVSAR